MRHFSITYESLEKFFFIILNAQFDIGDLTHEMWTEKLLENYEAQGARTEMNARPLMERDLTNPCSR